MAKTYGELILEYENFEHSKEHFDLMKECYEIQLMEQYVESQNFLVENMTEIREEYKEFDESFFVEAADEETAKSVSKAASEKKDGFFKKMWSKIVAAWSKVKGFFVRIFAKFKKNNDNLEKVNEKLEGVSVAAVANDVEIFKSMVANAWPQKYRDDGFDITVAKNSNILPGFKKIINAVGGNDKELKNKLSAAFSTNVVKVRLLPKTGSNTPPQVMNADSFSFYVNGMQFGRDTAHADSKAEGVYINNVKNMLTKNIVKNTIDIEVASSDLDDIIKHLNATEEKLKAMVDTEGQAVSHYNGAEAMELYKKLLAISADTMKMYTYVSNYRNDVKNYLIKHLNSGSKKKEEPAKEEPNEDNE